METTEFIRNYSARSRETIVRAPGIPTLVTRYRKERRARVHELVLRNRIEDLWPYLSDTDRIEREAGFKPATYTWQEDENGRLLRGRTSLPGVDVAFTELPFQWEYLQWHSLERLFDNGPFAYLSGRMEFEPSSSGGTRMRIIFHYVPRYRLLPAGLMLKGFLKAIRTAVRRLDENVTEELAAKAADEPVPAFDSAGSFEHAGLGAANPADEALRRKIRELKEKWSSLSPNPDIPEKFSEFILTRPEPVVARIRPFEAAAHLNVDPMDTLSFCLRAVKAGHLELSWDILCPSCRGSAAQSSGLDDVNPNSHCEACNIQYDVEFDKHVELTFRPAPALRAVDATIFCPAAPARTRHVLSQHYVLPGEEKIIHPDRYAHASGHDYVLQGPNGEPRPLTPAVGISRTTVLDLHEENHTAPLSLGSSLQLRNSGERLRIIRLESTRRDTRIATADIVTSLQEFRSLFSSEVLRPGVQLGVAGLTIMFSDLKDSTSMYEDKGDAPAFAVVQAHFERLTHAMTAHNGAVVKTIGDAVMAVFKEPGDALRAALSILKEEENKQVVKLGIHGGPCIALNMNDRLDYFGSTVNRAARLQGQARGGDVVISDDLFRRPEVKEVLKEFKDELRLSRFKTVLRGLRGGNTLYRIRPLASTTGMKAVV